MSERRRNHPARNRSEKQMVIRAVTTTKNITERDDLIIAMALAYAIECVNKLPQEWREVRWFTPAGDAVDQRDMERLLISLRGGAEAANALRAEARGHIEMPAR